MSHPAALYGLIGYPLGHSFSPAYFTDKFSREGIAARYEAFPIERIELLPALIAAHPELCGLNVTTPHKQRVMAFLDECTQDANAIGAVNCIAIVNGRLIGHNTDWRGFSDSIIPLLLQQDTEALVLGNGGASRAVRYALKQLGRPYHTVSETPGKADFLYRDLDEQVLSAHSIIINTTVLGTNSSGCPKLPYELLTSKHLLYDLVYNPPMTPFLKEGRRNGARIKNGQEMLELQAEAAWKIWRGA